MTKFIFDLDGTVTKSETLPVIAKAFGVEAQIEQLTKETIVGHVPFVESFIRRVFILGKLPIDEISNLLDTVELYPQVVDFIRRNDKNCYLATGNLYCWVDKLVTRIGCGCYCSEGKIESNNVVKLTSILKKENIVSRFKAEGHKVVFIGDGNNDSEAMRCADVAIASGLTHRPAPAAIAAADYLVTSEEALCRLLNQLL